MSSDREIELPRSVVTSPVVMCWCVDVLYSTYWTLVEIIPPLRRNFVPGDDKHETLIQAIRGAVGDATANRCLGLATLFFYRLLTNSRAVAYFYLSVMFDLNG